MRVRFGVFLLLLGATGCGAATQAATESHSGVARPVPVGVGKATRQDVPVDVHAIGVVEASATVTVRSRTAGKVETVRFKAGQYVHAGDVLFTLDPRPAEANLDAAKAVLARDQAQEKNARSDRDREKRLFANKVVSKEDYDSAETTLEAAEAAVKADRAEIEARQLELGYCTIKSPVEGRIGSILCDPGNLVKENDTSMAVIRQVKPIYVDFAVPEKYLPRVRTLMSMSSPAVTVSVPHTKEPPVSGKLFFLDNQVDQSTGMVELKAEYANGGEELWPGQFITAEIAVETMKNAVVVPIPAVQTGQSGSYVFVVKSDDTVEQRPVTTGVEFDGKIVVTKGLTGSETVVTDGQLRLTAGSRVAVKKGTSGQALTGTETNREHP